MYLDANNLYGYAMNQVLPIGDYKWEEPSNFDDNFIKNHDFVKSERGYIFVADIEYPKELHDLHKDYQLAPERKINQASDYMKDISKQIDHRIIKTAKLTPNLYDKTDYVIHGALLQLYFKFGLKIKHK